MASSDSNQPTLVVIVGPTAVGKTAVSLEAALHLGVPIINADSRQIYKELPIGTAAPTEEQQRAVRHFFVGTHHLSDYYSASLYEQEVMALLPGLFDASPSHKVALMSGGSMMYIDAVCNGIDDIPTVDDKTRETLKCELAEKGLPTLVERLHKLDPDYWEIVDKNNYRRVIHALEICQMTGRTYTSFRTHTAKPRPFRVLKIGLNKDRAEMYDKINRRVVEMVDQGLIDEALSVYPYRDMNALNTVGYKEMFDYLDGLELLDDTITRIQSNTRRYMRKQLTWFKRDPNIKWFNPENIKEIINYIENSI